ncbi:MAG TPA: TlpA disulfide reductase family protein [Flavobacteriaceae bacterium]|nr:TlpA disulfide reductase family protein [Flavobacteriaceae bacterium]
MRKLLIVLTGVLLTVASCQTQESKGDYVLTAEIPGVEDGTSVYLSEMTKGNKPIALDTAEVVQGKAELQLPKVDFQTLNILTVEGVNGNVLIINENQPITAEVNIADMRRSPVEGGEGNALFQEYYELLGNANEKIIGVTDGLSQEELQDPTTQAQVRQLQQQLQKENSEFRKKAIAENPDQFASILMFTDMLRSQQVSHAEMKKLYDDLSEEVRNTYIGKEIGNQLSKSAAVAIGSKAPSFTAKTPEGEDLALEDALGKYTLLDFWAAWCLPCRKENPNIVNVYHEYKDRGFTVLGVSLDKDRQKWLDAIEKDGLEWNQVSNLQFWQDPIAKEYNIKAIPQSFLLDENGTIIAQNLRGPALRNKIEELLGDQ